MITFTPYQECVMKDCIDSVRYICEGTRADVEPLHIEEIPEIFEKLVMLYLEGKLSVT